MQTNKQQTNKQQTNNTNKQTNNTNKQHKQAIQTTQTNKQTNNTNNTNNTNKQTQTMEQPSAVATHIDQHDLARINHIFKQCDRNNNGFVFKDVDQFSLQIKSKSNPNQIQIKSKSNPNQIKPINLNSSLDREELKLLISRWYTPTAEEVRRVMTFFDKDKSRGALPVYHIIAFPSFVFSPSLHHCCAHWLLLLLIDVTDITFDEYLKALTTVKAKDDQEDVELKISDKLKALIRQDFDEADVNRSGRIELDEVREICRKSYIAPPEVVDRFMKLLDKVNANDVVRWHVNLSAHMCLISFHLVWLGWVGLGFIVG